MEDLLMSYGAVSLEAASGVWLRHFPGRRSIDKVDEAATDVVSPRKSLLTSRECAGIVQKFFLDLQIGTIVRPTLASGLTEKDQYLTRVQE
jgi:hypothetical protein